MAGALDGVIVLDLSRILAGPTCTQLLGDFGATVWKIENPATGGDDTRQWGPPFARDAEGREVEDLSAYFMCANRNKQSVAVDIASAEGQAQLRALAQHADIVVENFKPGGLAKYGLDYAALKQINPSLIYCSISGFGQTGPNRDKPGYDIMAQAYGGIMSLTGAPEGFPTKVGVGIADVMCGMYACTGVLAALHHRERRGEGQHIDLALVDAQMAWLINEGVNYLTSGQVPVRRGNAHPNIVPYEVFATIDGHIVLAVGNDSQFKRFCHFVERPGWAEDERFATNPARLAHRDVLVPMVAEALSQRKAEEVITGLEALGVPVSPVNDMEAALGSDQAQARDAVIGMEAISGADPIQLLGNPLKLSATPVRYMRPPPKFGADTEAVLRQYASPSMKEASHGD